MKKIMLNETNPHLFQDELFSGNIDIKTLVNLVNKNQAIITYLNKEQQKELLPYINTLWILEMLDIEEAIDRALEIKMGG